MMKNPMDNWGINSLNEWITNATPEQQEEFYKNVSDFVDLGDYTTSEIKELWPTVWPWVDKERELKHRLFPDYYKDVIKQQKKKEAEQNEV